MYGYEIFDIQRKEIYHRKNNIDFSVCVTRKVSLRITTKDEKEISWNLQRLLSFLLLPTPFRYLSFLPRRRRKEAEMKNKMMYHNFWKLNRKERKREKTMRTGCVQEGKNSPQRKNSHYKWNAFWCSTRECRMCLWRQRQLYFDHYVYLNMEANIISFNVTLHVALTSLY